ncbi:MAG: Gfo/Idh/MocA family oxidoreductase, partial [Verrucomicrobiota bacterium]
MAISKTSSTASRRRFLKGASAAAAAPLILPSRLFGAGSANERIGIGLIGCGKIMNGHHKSHQDAEDVQIRAVSDVKDWQREEYVNKVNQGYAKITGKSDYDDCKGYANFEDLLARDDIDAVVVGTPDHWHAAATIAAMKAGKDVYCEKPLTLTIEEGIAIRKVAKETGRVVQTGSQQRSDQYFRRACELVVNGYIGELTEVHVGIGNFKPIPELGEQEIPEGFDYDRWLGQAPMEPYHIDRVKGDYGGGWRNFCEYGNRKNGDFGAHHFDIVQWALQMDESGPVNYVPAGHKGEPFSYFQYENGLKVFKNSDKKRLSINFYGKDGS